jgi:hypothetical protein
MYYSVYTTLGIIVILPDKTVLKEFKSLATSDDLPIVMNGDGTKFLADDGTYKTIDIDEKLEEAIALSIPHDMNEDFNSDFAI